MKQFLGLVVVLILVGTLWLGGVKLYSTSAGEINTGKSFDSNLIRLDALKVFTLTGENVSIRKIDTPFVVLNLWASWCGPCIEEVPSLIQFGERQRGKVSVVAISNDNSIADISAFIKSYPKFSDPLIAMYWDKDKGVARLLNIQALPESLVLEPSTGKVLKKIIGSIDWNSKDVDQYFSELTKARPEIKKE